MPAIPLPCLIYGLSKDSRSIPKGKPGERIVIHTLHSFKWKEPPLLSSIFFYKFKPQPEFPRGLRKTDKRTYEWISSIVLQEIYWDYCPALTCRQTPHIKAGQGYCWPLISPYLSFRALGASTASVILSWIVWGDRCMDGQILNHVPNDILLDQFLKSC